MGKNEPTDKYPDPVPATASKEKVCHICVYMSVYSFFIHLPGRLHERIHNALRPLNFSRIERDENL